MFKFVDYFAGIGGFHAALGGLGGRAVQACEIDPVPSAIYEHNWKLRPEHDIRELARRPGEVPDHSVLAGGFPCQPFSKSGRQLGIAEERGTLFQDVLTILEAKKPPVVILENVRNIAGRRQQEAWRALIAGLRTAGYKVSSQPCVFSPHLLAPSAGGAAQVRDRVYILGVYVGAERASKEIDHGPSITKRVQEGWDVSRWNIERDVLLTEPEGRLRQRYAVTQDETFWIDTWNELLARLGNAKLPGFPMWEPVWHTRRPTDYATMPEWKRRIVDQNHAFYLSHRREIDAWRRVPRAQPIERFPTSRRKLEWQAGTGERDLWKHLMQMRPSGIRVKQATYAPALVAMGQIPIFGPRRRRLTPMETGRLQGFNPDEFSFNGQSDASSYKQMGNAVNIGVVRHVFQTFVSQNKEDIAARGPAGTAILDALAIRAASQEPDAA